MQITTHQKPFLVTCRLWNDIADELNVTIDTTFTILLYLHITIVSQVLLLIAEH